MILDTLRYTIITDLSGSLKTHRDMSQLQTSGALQRLMKKTHLQQLHHGKADISIHVVVLHQLLLQADWLT